MDELFEKLKKCLKSLGRDVDCEPWSEPGHFSFYHNPRKRRVFAYVHLRKTFIAIHVRPGLPLIRGLVKEWPSGKICCRQIEIRNEGDLSDACHLFRQCYKFR